VALTHKTTTVANRIKDLIVANQGSLGIGKVYYGDQDIVPDGKSVCVEPGRVSRPMSGAPDMVTNSFDVMILVYRTAVQDLQATRLECDLLAEAIEDMLHLHLDLDDNAHTPNSGIVVQGWVTENLSGYTFKQGRLIRSARLTWQGISKTSLRFGP